MQPHSPPSNAHVRTYLIHRLSVVKQKGLARFPAPSHQIFISPCFPAAVSQVPVREGVSSAPSTDHDRASGRSKPSDISKRSFHPLPPSSLSTDPGLARRTRIWGPVREVSSTGIVKNTFPIRLSTAMLLGGTEAHTLKVNNEAHSPWDISWPVTETAVSQRY